MPFSGQEVSEKGFPQGWDADADSSTAQRIFRVTQLLEAMVTRDWSWDRFNSLGLRYSFHGGLIDNGLDNWVLIPDGSVTLANDATNFIERSDAGVVSVNQSGFTYLTSIPMAQIVTRSENFLPTTYTDRRPSLGVAPSGVSGGTTTFPQIIGLILDSQVPLSAVAQWESFLSIAFTQLTGVATKTQLPSTIAYEDETNTFDLLQTFSAGISIADGQSISWSDISLSRGAANRLDLASGDDFRIVSGELQFGADVNLFRNAANELKTDDDFIVGGDLTVIGTSTIGSQAFLDDETLTFGTGVDYTLQYRSAGTAFEFKSTDIDGIGTDGIVWKIEDGTDIVDFLDGITLAGSILFGVDTNLFRDSANVLKTDDAFVVGSDLTVLDEILIGATPAAAGAIRMTFGTEIRTRNQDDSGDIEIFKISGAQNLVSFAAAGSGGLTIGTAGKFITGQGTFRPDLTALRDIGQLGRAWKDAFLTGILQFGADVNLFRDSANVLKTDDAFVVASTLAVLSDASVGTALASAVAGTRVLSVEAEISGGELILGSTDTTLVAGQTVGSIAFHANDATNPNEYAGIQAQAIGTGGLLRLDLFAQSGAYGTGTSPDFTIENAGDITVYNAMLFGTAGDTNLFRDSANVLKTDDKFIVGGDFEHDGSNFGVLGASPVAQTAAYTPTNVTPDRSYDANSTTIDELADVIGTIIADQQSFGFFG